jgi:uncharacterized protein
MPELHFEWDSQKSKDNLRKHGISFSEAKTAFYDDSARIMHDPDHSEGEDRFILLGMSFSARILIVCHCYRKNDEVIRIISARKATRPEQSHYRR